MLRIFPFVIFLLLSSGMFAHQVKGEPSKIPPVSIEHGKKIYNQSCKWCHGATGGGDGPAGFFTGPYSSPRPRNFTIGNFKFRSTNSGELPTDEDLVRVTTNGIPGYMPSFAGLPEQSIHDVTAYLKSLISDIEDEDPPEQMEIEDLNVPPTPESILKGREAYFEFTCQGCHGDDARGTGNVARANELLDELKLPITPTDLTNRFAFKNGWTPRDIVRTLMTGLDGSPMPSFALELQDRKADAWHLANFIRSLSSHP